MIVGKFWNLWKFFKVATLIQKYEEEYLIKMVPKINYFFFVKNQEAVQKLFNILSCGIAIRKIVKALQEK